MRTIVIAAAAALGVALAGAREAHACGRAGGGYAVPPGLAIGVLALAATDIGMTLWDTTTIAVGHHSSPVYGAVEVLIAGPQMILGIAGLSSGGTNGAVGAYTLWMAALTAHGIWSLSLAAADGPVRSPAAAVRQESAPPASVAIGPTYVPVGQLAQVGFGLSGRF